ncbi:hypothetical protein LP420_20345 [Massilia sp. B-10]|nr:hypothetical protein LP420_20345 [Massilia sp. B-10]
MEIASEYRYRDTVPNPKTLVVTITQSGETADTLAALKHAQPRHGAHPDHLQRVHQRHGAQSVRSLTSPAGGWKSGVASTKAFTTQLAALFLLTLTLAQVNGHLTDEQEATYLKQMRHLPVAIAAVLALEPQIIAWADDFARKDNALFLGRGIHYPIALEGAGS